MTATAPAVTSNGEWAPRAACRGMKADIFFPKYVYNSGPAKRVCNGCPVQPECLQWALDNHEDYGVWGGLDEEERRAKHGRWPARRGAEATYATRAEEIAADPGRLLELLDSNRTEFEVAIAMETNVQTVRRVQQILAEQAEQNAAVPAGQVVGQ